MIRCVNQCLGFLRSLLTRPDERWSVEKCEHSLQITLEFGRKDQHFLKLMKESHAQLWQDIFVLSYADFKENGYFVEFGAVDGIKGSNTYLLEKEFNWLGILSEPNPNQRRSIEINRGCIIEPRCVYDKSGDTVKFVDANNLSTIDGWRDSDHHSNARKNKKTLLVETVSLTDMLHTHNAPPMIDYLSIDTEGTEYLILSNHDFSKYKFRLITVEHNYTSMRDEIFRLLSEEGYRRVHQDLSKHDDWYILYP